MLAFELSNIIYEMKCLKGSLCMYFLCGSSKFQDRVAMEIAKEITKRRV